MPNLFCSNAAHQVAKWLCISPEIEILELVLHHGAHFAKLASKGFLERLGSYWVRPVRLYVIYQFFN